jgi:hypothetical protein
LLHNSADLALGGGADALRTEWSSARRPSSTRLPERSLPPPRRGRLVAPRRCQSSRSFTSIDELKDGTEKTISAGESHTIPPGHDASNAGKESVVALEIPSADVFAKPA